uniref:Uncharacterized protein n=1 Tax=Octopus bimaculoides TaxID=37653 RepID=A0A0L8HIM0_OCTBM
MLPVLNLSRRVPGRRKIGYRTRTTSGTHAYTHLHARFAQTYNTYRCIPTHVS